jgi:molybdopterin/thiamine biosynthesis adenylyltransferase
MISLRYQGIIPEINSNFHIFGCGAIGSSAAIQLARMGAKEFTLYDMDIIEEPNIGVSQYDTSHIGMKKTEALSLQLLAINENIDCVGVHKKVENSTILYMSGNDIAIIGFDSMQSRYDVVQALYSGSMTPKLVIDGRMGAEHYQQTVTTNLTNYLTTWYPDSEGDPEPCTAKATSYCSNLAGSMIANTVRKIETNQPYSREFSFNFPTFTLDSKIQKM